MDLLNKCVWFVIAITPIYMLLGACQMIDDHPERVHQAWKRFLAWSMERFDWLPESELAYIERLAATDVSMAPPCQWMYISESGIDPYAVCIGVEQRFKTPVGEPRTVPSVKQFCKCLLRALRSHGWDVLESERGFRAIPPQLSVRHLELTS